MKKILLFGILFLILILSACSANAKENAPKVKYGCWDCEDIFGNHKDWHGAVWCIDGICGRHIGNTYYSCTKKDCGSLGIVELDPESMEQIQPVTSAGERIPYPEPVTLITEHWKKETVRALHVTVDIAHTYRGDLQLELRNAAGDIPVDFIGAAYGEPIVINDEYALTTYTWTADRVREESIPTDGSRVDQWVQILKAVTIERAKEIAEAKGLKPGRVRGTNGVQFTKEANERIEVIDWSTFEQTLQERQLAVFESGGWMKIMKKSRAVYIMPDLGAMSPAVVGEQMELAVERIERA